MKHYSPHLYWTTLLTAIWLAASAFIYVGVFDKTYKEPDKQHLSTEYATPTSWDILHVSNDAGNEFVECFWWITNALVFYSDSIDRVAINPPEQHQYKRLNQSISLISYQYFSSALPA